MFTLDQLRGFVAVAEELHFGRAAERLRMTQPPLSRQIQKLERSVGVRLLDRDNRSVELTVAGTAFLTEARRLLGQAEGALDHVRRIHAGSVGTVRIGFTATAAFGVLPSLLNRIAAAHPEIDLDLYEMVTREQVDGLLGGDLDLGLARPPFDTSTFASRLLHREALLLAVPSRHRLADTDRPVAADDLASEPLIMHAPTRARYFYDLVVRLVPVADQNVVHSVSQVLTMLWLVAAGRGVAFVPASATGLRIDGVRYREIEGLPAAPVELHLLWLRDAGNPALRMLLETMQVAER
ncbi:MAG TPA: LysR substrate-binding domain-containing protein [Microlunatus sp.]|jgi:DNA-binding transcriptional LysR family regulator|nr:LysR substrate-binding domain-containing protein [Microlunatus sp.]